MTKSPKYPTKENNRSKKNGFLFKSLIPIKPYLGFESSCKALETQTFSLSSAAVIEVFNSFNSNMSEKSSIKPESPQDLSNERLFKRKGTKMNSTSFVKYK